MTQICLFEDAAVENFFPLTQTRPIYNLRYGISDLATFITQQFPKCKITYHCRPEIARSFTEDTGQLVNKLAAEDTVFINGRLIEPEITRIIPWQSSKEFLITYNNQVIAAKVNKKNLFALPEFINPKIFKKIKAHTITECALANYFWDLVKTNGTAITIQAKRTNLLGHTPENLPVQYVKKDLIYIASDAILKPGVILDATDGPIYIDNGAIIMANAVICGPVYIGTKTQIKIGAKIYGNTSIGPVCKVGGEVEGSIFQGYANKQHEGFLGHAYLGAWVNLGAGTENSDLKNNYQSVEVLINNHPVDSKSLFVGCCIGDHTKTGIKTMINTGSNFGCFGNIFGAGYQPKYIPDFTWCNLQKNWETHDLSKALQTAAAVMLRRNIKLSPAKQELYKNIFKKSIAQRKLLKIK